MTLDALKAFGADTAEGLERCVNDEGFYLQMVSMTLADGVFDALKTAMEAGDARKAFAAAHALKGTTGNMALTPLYEPLSELTELLRDADVPPENANALLQQVMTARETALGL